MRSPSRGLVVAVEEAAVVVRRPFLEEEVEEVVGVVRRLLHLEVEAVGLVVEEVRETEGKVVGRVRCSVAAVELGF